jgi:hypothetical protein
VPSLGSYTWIPQAAMPVARYPLASTQLTCWFGPPVMFSVQESDPDAQRRCGHRAGPDSPDEPVTALWAREANPVLLRVVLLLK